MAVCRFCDGSIDPETALAAAEVQDKVNQSCSDASYLRTAAIAMFVFLGLSFVPLIPIVYWGFLVTFIVVIAMVIRWQVKFGKLKTDDPDYRQAGYRKNLALVLWLIAIPAGFVLHPTIATLVNHLLFET
jgi:hypothetical protein